MKRCRLSLLLLALHWSSAFYLRAALDAMIYRRILPMAPCWPRRVGMKLALHPAVTSGALVSAERFSVAPMVGHTHRHTRYFLRLLSRHSWLYTEMTHAEVRVRVRVRVRLRWAG
jgi:hypothetical protein